MAFDHRREQAGRDVGAAARRIRHDQRDVGREDDREQGREVRQSRLDRSAARRRLDPRRLRPGGSSSATQSPSAQRFVSEAAGRERLDDLGSRSSKIPEARSVPPGRSSATSAVGQRHQQAAR